MKNKLYRKMFLGLLIGGIFLFSIVANNMENKTVKTSTEVNENKKIGWSIKRNDNHDQPDVGKEKRAVLEDNNGICLGNESDKTIYLTFDEDYEAGYTTKILDVLKENNVKATFFYYRSLFKYRD